MLLIALLAATATAGGPPTWPEGARLQLVTNQLVYGAPANTEAELLGRRGRYGLTLSWPEAADDGKVVRYELSCDGELLQNVLAGQPLEYTAEVQGNRRWSVVALDDEGMRSEALELTTESPSPSGTPVRLTGRGDSREEEQVFLGVGGLLGSEAVSGSEVPASGAKEVPEITAEPSVEHSSGTVKPELLEEVLQNMRNQFSYCVQRGLHADETIALPGTAVLIAVLPGDGTVTQISTHNQTIDNPGAEACIKRTLSRALVTAGSGSGDVRVRIELTAD